MSGHLICKRCGAGIDDELGGCTECGLPLVPCEVCDSPLESDGNCSVCGEFELCLDCQQEYVRYLERCGVCGSTRGLELNLGFSYELKVPAPAPIRVTRIVPSGATTTADDQVSDQSVQLPNPIPEESVMPVTVPALTARMGSRDYFITKMTAQEISGQVAVASELKEWREATLNDLYQRKLNQQRVEQDIAPYLANSTSRFFGAIIVWALNDEALTFEPVSDHISVMAAYQAAAKSMGFLVINGVQGETSGLVALDGQHRLAALRNVVQGVTTGDHSQAVLGDEVTVIFVRDRNVSDARDLFTVLNRSARRVSKNDVLIMSEVDGAAVIARSLTSSKLLAPNGLEHQPLVKWTSNTIAARDSEFTTLNAIYEMVSVVADYLGVDLQRGEESGERPDASDILKVTVESELWLTTFLGAAPELSQMRTDVSVIPQMRANGAYSLLMKPVGVVTFFHAVGMLVNPEAGRMHDPSAAIARLIDVNWDLKGNFWRGILTKPSGGVTNRKEDIQFAAEMATWMVQGESCDPKFVQALTEKLQRRTDQRQLPTPLV